MLNDTVFDIKDVQLSSFVTFVLLSKPKWDHPQCYLHIWD